MILRVFEFCVQSTRPRITRTLGECADLWTQGIRDNNVVLLQMLVDRLSVLDVTPHEIMQAKSVGSKMRASSVNNLSDESLKAKIISLRHKWMKLRDQNVEFAILAAQFLVRPKYPCMNVLCSAILVMLDMGYCTVSELEGSNVIEWNICNASVKTFLCTVAGEIGQERLDARLDSEMDCKIDELLKSKPRANWDRVSLGPCAAIKAVDFSSMTSNQKRARLNNVVMETAVASVQNSLPSYRSGFKCYLLFHSEVDGGPRPLPPTIELLLLWSQFFRNSGSFCNYVSHVKWASEACSADVKVFSDPMLRRAKNCVKSITVRRSKKWLRLELVERLMKMAVDEGAPNEAAFYALAYVFLCRVAAELIPLVIQKPGEEVILGKHSILLITEDEVTIKLSRRKNDPHGSVIRRRCFCGRSRQLCPIHTIIAWTGRFSNGDAPFAGMTASKAISSLRRRLITLEVEDACAYALHAFRRGAAHDMAIWGHTIRAIMLAGGWRSGSFLGYIDPVDLDVETATRHAVEHSDSEDEN